MNFDEASQRAAAASKDMQRMTHQNEASTLNQLERYLLNREDAYEAFRRLDPESEYTRDALALLEKARRDVSDYKTRYADQSGDGAEDQEIDQSEGP
jgi:hypothetical protein